jgi:CBS domain-containing protein
LFDRVQILRAGAVVNSSAETRTAQAFARLVQRAVPASPLLQGMKTKDVMTREVHTCRPETDLGMAALQMWEGDFGVLPVVTEEGEVVGMITDRDICMATASKNEAPSAIRVEEIMTGLVYSCSAVAEIREALKIMQQRRVRRLPVIANGKLVGLLSLNDLALKARSSATSELSVPDVEETLKEVCAHPTFALGRPFKPQATAVANA